MMSELFGESDPLSAQELMELLPERCIDCNFARFIIAMASNTRQNPFQLIKDVGERCIGYEGSDPDSDMYGDGCDRSGCPYALLRKDSATKAD
jgi:hypothetical protein